MSLLSRCLKLASRDPSASLGRITPTLGNPKGYPRYKLSKVPSYTNTQILYYLRGGQITDFAAFQKLKKSRDELFRSLGKNGDSNDESETLPHRSIPSQSNARQLTSPSVPEATDSEPDEVIPALSRGGKGLKIDKITTLKQGGDLLNYRTWLQEARTAFLADPYRFDTVEKRLIFAALNMDNDMRDLWAHAQTR
jgi:hypothetical protein